MTLAKYLQSHLHQKLTLVGPLLEQVRTFSNTPLVFIDGGSHFRKGSEGFSVGDGDSFSKKLDETLPQEKDFSDLAYVLDQADGFTEIEAWGFWGGRKDHELANLGEFHRFLQRQPNARLDLPPHAKGFSAGEWELELQGLFSILTLEPSEINITGAAKYPVSRAKNFQTLSSLGISNEGHGRIQIRSSGPFFLFHQF